LCCKCFFVLLKFLSCHVCNIALQTVYHFSHYEAHKTRYIPTFYTVNTELTLNHTDTPLNNTKLWQKVVIRYFTTMCNLFVLCPKFLF
jgi:hypothetical protein